MGNFPDYGIIHQSQRGIFAYELYKRMIKDQRVFLLVGDLGYHVFDRHFLLFPDRCFNVGASEQAMLDMAAGLAYAGKTPVCYSITPFLLYRPFETLRTYINYEKLNVKLVGSGRNRDYEKDGISHWADDAGLVLQALPEIQCLWPKIKEEIPEMVKTMFRNKKPYFLSLRR